MNQNKSAQGKTNPEHPAQSAWKQFEHTGSVADYLGYCNIVNHGGVPPHADQNTGTGNQAT